MAQQTSNSVFVGNLSYETTRDRLLALFAPHGQVMSVNVITDRATGRPRGFAFVEMTTEAAASAAIEALNGQEVDGRRLTVNTAKPREPQQEPGARRSGGRSTGSRRSGERRYSERETRRW
jgi:RNA recognition motif-containing protein